MSPRFGKVTKDLVTNFGSRISVCCSHPLLSACHLESCGFRLIALASVWELGRFVALALTTSSKTSSSRMLVASPWCVPCFTHRQFTMMCPRSAGMQNIATCGSSRRRAKTSPLKASAKAYVVHFGNALELCSQESVEGLDLSFQNCDKAVY